MICAAVVALAITIPFEFAAHEVFIPVRINGGAPLWFSLDSAASSMIVDPAKARELGLTFGDAAQGRGAGAGGVAYVKLPDAIELTIGETESGPYDFIAIDLSGPAKNASHAMDGILGYQFFSRFVVTIDYEHRTLTLTDPSEFREPRDATMLPLEIVSKLPFVTGKIKVSGVAPETSRFLIDTGSGDAVDHPLIKKSKGDVKRTVTGVGLGEPMTGWVGRAEYLKLGPYTIRRPVTACCGGNEFNQSMIGAAILEQFTVTFDYAHQRLYLQPNRRYQH
jgi:hypothetical protein